MMDEKSPAFLAERLLDTKLAEAAAGSAASAAAAAMLIHLRPEIAQRRRINGWYQALIMQAFQSQDPEMLVCIGEELIKGKHLAPDGRLAGRFFERAGMHSPIMSAYMMGRYLVSTNPPRALQLLKRAQCAGHIPSAVLRHRLMADQIPLFGIALRLYFFIIDWASIWKAAARGDKLRERFWRYRDLSAIPSSLLRGRVDEDRILMFQDVFSVVGNG